MQIFIFGFHFGKYDINMIYYKSGLYTPEKLLNSSYFSDSFQQFIFSKLIHKDQDQAQTWRNITFLTFCFLLIFKG